MKVFTKIMAILSMLLMAFTMICGAWIANSGKVTDLASSASFHMMLGIITAVAVFVTCILAMVRK
jgi:hypothetical protein